MVNKLLLLCNYSSYDSSKLLIISDIPWSPLAEIYADIATGKHPGIAARTLPVVTYQSQKVDDAID